MMRKIVRFAAGVLSFLALSATGAAVYLNFTLPDNFYVLEGEQLHIKTNLSVTSSSLPENGRVKSASQNSVSSGNVSLKLFGIIPIKTTRVQEVTQTMLVPCGTPFGVKLCTEGVMVVGINDIPTAAGNQNPAKACGIQTGDVITTINGKAVSTNEEVAALVEQSAGRKMDFSLLRDGEAVHTTLTPVVCSTDGKYKAGIWVRDSSAGIGTITFYNPTTSAFGGLGHGICDVDTGELMPLHSGEIVDVKLNGITKGQSGTPGELKGSFASTKACGIVTANAETGIFGTLAENPSGQEALPVALKQDIKEGDATIITTVDGEGPKEYTVTVDKISLNSNHATKNMVIKITDPELLQKTGGIVQGMSGSPIIQDGRIIGAITHVFVNDPTRGYGIFIENMVNTSLSQPEIEKKSAS